MATISSSDFARPPLDPYARLLTAADLAALPDELPTGPVDYELDNGRLVMMSPTGWRHGNFQSRIASALHLQGEDRGHGIVCTEAGIILWRSPDRVLGPDVAFIATRSLPVKESPEGYLETIPQLVVEVRSKNDSKPYMERKVSDLLKVGVEVVWIVNPENETVVEYRGDAAPTTFATGDTLHCEGIVPGFRLPLTELFR
jgi:Uma2 family endonuclease